MQTISIRTTQNVLIKYPIASVGDRILGHLLDRLFLIMFTLGWIVLLIGLEIFSPVVFFVSLAIPWLLYSFLFEVFMNGQTPGKRLMKIQVARLDGTQPSVGDYTLRWVFGFVDFYVMSGALAVLIIAIGGKGQRLGDVVAGTTVVKLVEEEEITASEVFIAAADDYRPTFPQVIQLQAKDIELIQRAIEANRDFGNQQPLIAVTDKIKSLLGIQTDMPPAEFLHVIVKDFNHLTSR